MKKITTYYVVRDNNGLVHSNPASVVNVYPMGTTNDAGIAYSNVGVGICKIIIAPSVNEQCISKLYDIYLSGVKTLEAQFFEDWVWFVSNVEVDAEQTFNFTDLVDENGEALPTLIENVSLELTPINDRMGRVTAQNSTSFTITLSSSGDDDTGLFNIRITVKK